MKGINLAILIFMINIAYLILPAVGIWGKPDVVSIDFGSIITYNAAVGIIAGLIGGAIAGKFFGNPIAAIYFTTFLGIWSTASGFITSLFASSYMSGLNLFWLSGFLLIIGIIIGIVGSINISVGAVYDQ